MLEFSVSKLVLAIDAACAAYEWSHHPIHVGPAGPEQTRRDAKLFWRFDQKSFDADTTFEVDSVEPIATSRYRDGSDKEWMYTGYSPEHVQAAEYRWPNDHLTYRRVGRDSRGRSYGLLTLSAHESWQVEQGFVLRPRTWLDAPSIEFKIRP